MRALTFLTAASLLLAPASAQTQSVSLDAAGLEVTQKSWRREVRHPELDADPFRANDEHRETERARIVATEVNLRRSNQNRVAVPPPTSVGRELESAPPDKPAEVYVYSVKVRNKGPKTVRSLTWEYVFVDPETEQEVGRHRGVSKLKLGPGKSAMLTLRSLSPPSGVISANRLGRDARDQFTESVVILRVEYDDGSVWQGAAK